MNKHGQSLIIMIVLIPLLFLVFGYIYNYSAYLITKTKLTSVTEEIAKEMLQKSPTDMTEEIENLYKLNGFSAQNIEIKQADDTLTIIKTEQINNTIKILPNLKLNEIKIKVIAAKENNDIIIKE